MYARSNVRPQINDVDQDKIERLYVDLRRESKQCGGVRGALHWLGAVVVGLISALAGLIILVGFSRRPRRSRSCWVDGSRPRAYLTHHTIPPGLAWPP